MKIAAVTMVYNEAGNLPFWLRHYSREFGPNHCYIVDHGSDDGSTNNVAGCNIIRIPRSPQNNELRTAFIGDLCNNLLRYYDYVIYTDCDEIILADPRKFSSITEYCTLLKPDYVTSIGVDVIHLGDLEGDLTPSELITSQRYYGHYSSAMNKPNITQTPVVWSPGFHSRIEPASFGDIYLFHLRYADLRKTLLRLAITREMPWARSDAGGHQRVKDDEMIRWINGWRKLPKVDDDVWSAEIGVFSKYIAQFKASEKAQSNLPCIVNTTTFGGELLRFPNSFLGKF